MHGELFGRVAEFVQAHQTYAVPLALALAFLKSIAIFSVFIPATGPLLALGALIGAGSLPFPPIWIAISVGAGLGDWTSYALGHYFRNDINKLWPMSRHPERLARAEVFFRRWGVAGIVLARFFGPLRATAPIIAGVFEMPPLAFQAANFGGAFLWAGTLLAPGALGIDLLRTWLG